MDKDKTPHFAARQIQVPSVAKTRHRPPNKSAMATATCALQLALQASGSKAMHQSPSVLQFNWVRVFHSLVSGHFAALQLTNSVNRKYFLFVVVLVINELADLSLNSFVSTFGHNKAP